MTFGLWLASIFCKNKLSGYLRSLLPPSTPELTSLARMPSLKPLKGVAHDIAHHVSSGLSWLFPHLGQACYFAGVNIVFVELLDEHPYPALLSRNEYLEAALKGVEERFWQILSAKNIPKAAVKSVRLEFRFMPKRTDDSVYWVRCEITTSTGKI